MILSWTTGNGLISGKSYLVCDHLLSLVIRFKINFLVTSDHYL